MKYIKKILLLIILLSCFLTGACAQISEYEKIEIASNEVIDKLYSQYDFKAIDSDIQFIYQYKEYSISWESSNVNIVSNTGKVNRPDKDSEISITIKLYKDGLSYSRIIDVVVIGVNLSDGYTYDVLDQRSYLSIKELKDVYEDNEYSNYLDVISYIFHFHKLPKNYLTKSAAADLGWSQKGNVWVNDDLKGKLIGGDIFHNYEKILPVQSNKPYIELDVNCSNGNRGKYRLVYNKFTFDIYYTDDHYNSFTYMIGAK